MMANEEDRLLPCEENDLVLKRRTALRRKRFDFEAKDRAAQETI